MSRPFMQRIGAHTLVRGHEKVVEGFAVPYDDEHARLITVFSAGGRDNGDLPEGYWMPPQANSQRVAVTLPVLS